TSADDHQRHLHREVDERPEAVAELVRELRRRDADSNAGGEDDDHRGERENEGVGEPALAEVGDARSGAREKHGGNSTCTVSSRRLPWLLRKPRRITTTRSGDRWKRAADTRPT